MKLKTFLCLLVFFLNAAFAVAQQAGRITGQVKDTTTGEPLPGANVTVVGTTLGAATNLNGSYTITNVTPGTYSVRASFIGYETATRTDVAVFADSTTIADFSLNSTALLNIYTCIDTCIIIRGKNTVTDTLVIRSSICNESGDNLHNVETLIQAVLVRFCGDRSGGQFQSLKEKVFYGSISDSSCGAPIDTCATVYQSEFRYTTTALGDTAAEKCLRFPVEISIDDLDAAPVNCAPLVPVPLGAIESCYHIKIPAKQAVLPPEGGLDVKKWLVRIGAFGFGFAIGRAAK